LPGIWTYQMSSASGALWFAAGINGEQDGLLGVLLP
jgi:hypothetical protein